MIQPKLYAQLGNQAFMISAAIAHALKRGTTYSIPKKTINPKIWRTYFSHLPEFKSATKSYYKEPRHAYDPLPEVNDLTIDGYFQSEKYFANAKAEIAEALQFEHKAADYVALHIRRGDYMFYPEQFPLMPLEYYQAGIDYFIENGECLFRIYSDDIEWCKSSFKPEWWGAYVEYSTIKDPLTDMRDMYNASGFIIANSTFSLFPAVLRPDNPNVVAPAEDRWYGAMNKHLETFDLMPERFIKM